MLTARRGRSRPRGVVGRMFALGVVVLACAGYWPADAFATSPTATHYAATSGVASNWPCTTAAAPCDLKTAIEGLGLSQPATGDQVIIEGGNYTYTDGTQIVAPVAEDIHGANGVVQITGSGLPEYGSVLTVGGYPQRSELENVHVHENGDTAYAVYSSGNALFDDDVMTSSATLARALQIRDGDTVLDTLAIAAGNGGAAIYGSFSAGASITLRNVTALATNADGGTAFSATEDTNECSAAPVNVSLRNVIAYASAPGNFLTLTVYDDCSGGQLNFNVDYSDFNPSQDSVGSTGVTIAAGSHNITAPPIFATRAADQYQEAANSPTVDQGTNDPQDGGFDPDGRPRFLGAAPDIGAFELPAPYPVTGTAGGLAVDGKDASATLSGTVDAEGSGLGTTYWFQYGTSTAYGSQTPEGAGVAGTTAIPDPQSVAASVADLTPGAAYDYRLVAQNSDGTTYGANRTFTTEASARIEVVSAGTGLGSIELSPLGIRTCEPTCSFALATETQYTLRALPSTGSTFAGWHGGGCSGTATCTLTLSGNTTITAAWEMNPPTLSHVSLTGLSKHKPKLGFTVTAGAGDTLQSVGVTLPNDLELSSATHGIRLSVHGARVKVRHGLLTIALSAEPNTIRITLTAPRLRFVERKHPRLALIVRAINNERGNARSFELRYQT